MRCRIAVVLTIAVVCCQAQLASAQAKGKQKGFGPGPANPFGDPPFRTSPSARDDFQGPAPAFLVTLEERTKERKVFLPYRDGFAPAPGDPLVASIFAIRRIQGDEPAKAFVYLSMGRGAREFPEEDVRKIVQFKKDFAKKVAPVGEHVEAANLSLNSHGLVLNFNLKTGECQSSSLHIPDGFFDALSDALADLEKLKAGKPAFQVK
jgi:hypothetical protein